MNYDVGFFLLHFKGLIFFFWILRNFVGCNVCAYCWKYKLLWFGHWDIKSLKSNEQDTWAIVLLLFWLLSINYILDKLKQSNFVRISWSFLLSIWWNLLLCWNLKVKKHRTKKRELNCTYLYQSKLMLHFCFHLLP